ncbi:MAG: tetratricopeptide repeat protein [Vicinamibacterales bacterium]
MALAVRTRTAQPSPDELMARADAALLAGRVDEAVKGFDAVIAARPANGPYLWQRGIALFYAGRYTDCRRQFESHRHVNPDDVENAAWHFLCAAHETSFAAARRALLPVGPDRRSPMREVYEMLRGAMTPDEVLDAGKGSASGRFYGALYVALFYDAQGDRARARAHMETAAREEFSRSGGYMHQVAVVHLGRMR